MTKEELTQKLTEMLPELNNLILEKAEKIILSDVIDINDFDNNYLLPKIILSAVGREIEFQYRPLTDEYKRLIDIIYAVL